MSELTPGLDHGVVDATAEIGMHFGVTYKTVSRAVSRYEGEFSHGHG
ncbi:MAG: hypothetical protein JWR65_2258 [Massilia sp.]|nr:hypothetical protein [Massilia sp.]